MRFPQAVLLTAAFCLVAACQGENASPGSHSRSKAPSQTAQEWPELTIEELDVLSEISGKAMVQRLDKADIRRFKAGVHGYLSRVNQPLPKEQAKMFTAGLELVYDYNSELGRCLLMSIDSRQPFVSNRFEELSTAMRQHGLVRPAKLATDRRQIVSAANQTPYTDEFGEAFEPPSRQDILDALAQLEVIKENLERMRQVISEVTEPP